MRNHQGNGVVEEAVVFSPGEKMVAVVPSQLSVPEFREHVEQRSGIRCPCMATSVVGFRKQCCD